MHLETVRTFLDLTERFVVDRAQYENILHPEVEQTEFPNGLTARLTISDRETMFTRMANGAKLLSSQTYELQQAYECGDIVITEVIWTGVVAVQAGPFQAGQQLKAYFCCVFEFKDGLIYRQRNYDCFERF